MPCQCPFCGRLMASGTGRLDFADCEVCSRPMVKLAPTSQRVVVASVLDTGKVVMLPVVGGATMAFGIGSLSPDEYARWVAAALLSWGIIDVWDGTAGLRSGIDRIKKTVCNGKAARRRSIAKTIFGLSSAVLGSAGLMMVR